MYTRRTQMSSARVESISVPPPEIPAKKKWRSLLVGVLLLASVLEFSVRGPFRLLHGGMGWNDFLSPYIQAKAWARGEDPYTGQSLVKWWPADNPRPPYVDSGAIAGTLEKDRGMPSPYPITSLVIVSPFTALPWPVALSLWSVISVAAVIVSAFALLAVCGCQLSDWRSQTFLAATFALAPLHTGLATANPAMLAISLVVGALWAIHMRRDKTAGVLLAVAICLKPTVAGGLLLYFLLRRRWRVVVTTCVVTAATAVVGLLRLAMAGVRWIPSYLENSRRMFALGSVDDFTRASGLRFNLINSQLFFGGIFNDPATADLLARLLGIVLLGCWIWLCFRRRAASTLLEVSAISTLSLIVVYHRFYDAELLILPLAWCLLLTKKPSWKLVTLAAIVPFFVPGPILLTNLARSGRVPPTFTNGWWWNAIVLPHQAWDLILITLLLLYFMFRESEEMSSQAAQELLAADQTSARALRGTAVLTADATAATAVSESAG